MNKTAILLGATGLTGRYLLEALIKDEDYSLIKVFSRRSTGVISPKVEEHLIDLLELSKYESLFKADVIFCCIGTTKAKTPDSETYKKIDFGIPVTAARLAKKNDIPAFLVISALSANPNSRIFYNRVKGEMQHAVLEQDIEETYIFQPSLIYGEREEKRAAEDIANIFLRAFNFIIPKNYKRIHAKTIALAMLKVAKEGYSKKLIPSKEIAVLGK